jgi:hypothetical protein
MVFGVIFNRTIRLSGIVFDVTCWYDDQDEHAEKVHDSQLHFRMNCRIDLPWGLNKNGFWVEFSEGKHRKLAIVEAIVLEKSQNEHMRNSKIYSTYLLYTL